MCYRKVLPNSIAKLSFHPKLHYGKRVGELIRYRKNRGGIQVKKTFVVIVSLLLTCNLLSYTVTAVTDKEQYAGDQLHTLGLMRGYTDGTLMLQNSIKKRAEVAALLVRTLGYDNKEVLGDPKAFSDVKSNSWAKDDIQKAYKLKLIVGDPGGTFRPDDQISYAEVVTIMVNALGKKMKILKVIGQLIILPKLNNWVLYHKVTTEISRGK